MSHKERISARLRAWARGDESGATLVEFAIVLAVFLLLFFAIIDFARLGFEAVMARKATHNAARIAVVRPAVCPNVPQVTPARTGTGARFGTLCRDASAPCASPGPFVCSLTEANASSNEIWNSINGLLPSNAERSNVRLRYESDPNLGFLGGPYVPLVTVELIDLDFNFVTPLGGLARLAGAANAQDLRNSLPFPSMRATLPAEDLAHGG